MIDPTPSPSTIEQARLDASVAAAAAERANRPRGLIVLGAALMALATIYFLYALSARASEQAALAKARSDVQELRNLADQIRAVSAEMAARGTAPDNTMVGKLEGLAQVAGLTLRSGITESPTPPVGQTGMRQRKYTATFTDQDPGAILTWLVNVQSSPTTAGLEISRLQLRPGGAVASGAAHTPGAAGGWNVTVEFTRWEKLS